MSRAVSNKTDGFVALVAHRLKNLDSVPPRQHLIQHHEVKGFGNQSKESLFARPGHRGVVALFAQPLAVLASSSIIKIFTGWLARIAVSSATAKCGILKKG